MSTSTDGPRKRVVSAIARMLTRAAQRLTTEVAEAKPRVPRFDGIDRRAQLDYVERVSAIGNWSADFIQRRTDWSDEFFRICGFEPQAFVPDYERYLATIHPEDREGIRADIEKALHDHLPYEHEYRVIRPDGSERFCVSRGTVFIDEAGVLTGMAGTCQDITSRKLIEEELTQQRSQLEEAQRIARMGSWHWDLATGKLGWSEELANIFGVEPGAFGQDPGGAMRAIHPDDRSRVREVVYRAIAECSAADYELRIVRPDGEIRHCRSSLGVFADHTGKVVRVAGIAQDITDRKLMEAELYRAMAAKAEAEGANLAKGQFLANMSHELRTPLNSVIGFANVLLKNKSGNLGATDLQYLERIRFNGQHLLDLINDILDLSKIEVGKLEAENDTFSLSALVKETISDLRESVGEKTGLRLVIPDTVTPVTSDRRKVKQILINLVGNAIKFTEEGEVTIEVFEDPDTHQARQIEIRDTGVGIPQDRLDAIFLAFEQAESGTGRRFGGTGLGLAIVASFAELLGFKIEVESELDVGSTFRLIFPMPPDDRSGTDAETPGSEAPRRAATAPASSESLLDNRLVLVIDDDTDSRILLTQNLEESGARTITASSAEQGLRMAREFHPDIITLDVLLPGMSGWDALATLKSDPSLRDIPVIIVSVIGREDASAAAGAAVIIEKPINREELVAAVRRTLNERPRRILIVDDTPDARELLKSYLADEDVEIRTANDGVEALQLIDDFTPDLVLLDLVMPNLDGLGIIRKLNEREPYMSLPIVVVTGRDLSAEERERLEQSCSAVLQKGARLEEELRESLKGVL